MAQCVLCLVTVALPVETTHSKQVKMVTCFKKRKFAACSVLILVVCGDEAYLSARPNLTSPMRLLVSDWSITATRSVFVLQWKSLIDDVVPQI